MSDYEVLSLVLMILGIITSLLCTIVNISLFLDVGKLEFVTPSNWKFLFPPQTVFVAS